MTATPSNGYDGGSSGRVTLKDVYDIVGGVGNKVEELARTVTALTINHESRLTGVEGKVDTLDRRVDAVDHRADAINKDVTGMRDEHNVAKGKMQVLTIIGSILVTLFGGFGTYGLLHALHW